jgi:putative nucleotidyltransferase with HDIG domain
MIRVLGRMWRDNGSLLVLLGIVTATGLINLLVANQRAFLNLYYLPVVLGAYRLGRKSGVYSAMMSCLIVFMIALVDERRFGFSQAENWNRWTDLGTWGCFLILTSYVVGTLYDVKERQWRDLNHAYQGILEIMSKFIDTIDRATENHSRRVADYSAGIARALGLPEREIENIRVGALLHDIGKIEISTEVLLKATALTPHEVEEMRRHVETGEQILTSVGGILRNAVPMVAYHHERWDGKGYKGLSGDSIPLGARIIAVADTYDAMVSDRPYRKGRTHEEAVASIQAESGKQFDPRIVRVFVTTFAASPPHVTQQAA